MQTSSHSLQRVDISVFEQMISDGRHVSEMMCAMYNL